MPHFQSIYQQLVNYDFVLHYGGGTRPYT